MDQTSLHLTEARCTQEHRPKCQDSCPLHMDVRTFMGHMADGNHNEARKVIERHLPLPNIFPYICDHPCESHCLRRDLGGSLAIQSLESLCMQNTKKIGKGFLRPPKAQKVAVLGSGLAGLVLCYELAKKSWPVTIFYDAWQDELNGQDNTAEAWSFLHKQFPNLKLEDIQEEFAALEKQYATFVRADLTVDFFASIQQDFAGFFVDAHAAADIFASLDSLPHALSGHVQDNICAGGMLNQSPTGDYYVSSSAQAGQGRQSALSLERILGGISPLAGREEQNNYSRLHTSLAGVNVLEAVVPKAYAYTAEEAKLEAARCIQCQCMQCVQECLYLQKYGSFPRAYTRQIYNNSAIVKGEHRANSLVNGCMLCGQCTEICPEKFSMAEVCLQAREDMVKRNYMPPSAHAFALEDMQAAITGPATLFMTAPQKNETKHVLFPGCQLTAARGGQLLEVFDFLNAHMPDGLGLMLSCCGIPAQWAGQEELALNHAQHLNKQWENLGKPTIILACASCKKFFDRQLSHIPSISLWEVLYAYKEHMPKATARFSCTIHDPCSARLDKSWQDATRMLAAHCGIDCFEAENNKNTTSCCGYGGLVWCSQAELAEQVTMQLAKNLDHTGLASCIMCRDRLVQSHKPCVHFFDILPFLSQNMTASDMDNALHMAAAKPAPSLSARRANRVALVQEVVSNYGTENIQEYSFDQDQMRYALNGHNFLELSPELLIKLERKHILHQDVASAVLAVEKHKKRFLERESGHYVGAWRSGQVTFWVRYSKDAQNNYQLHDAWCHRMFVPNAAME